MKKIPALAELSGALDDFYQTCRREAMDAAKEIQAMRKLFATEAEWAEYWLSNPPAGEPCSLSRANKLIQCAERFGDKPVIDWTPAEIEELDRAYWND